MDISGGNFSRVGKLLVDRDDMTPADAARLLASRRLALVCGPDVASSATLQAALLTAANVAERAFGCAIKVDLPAATGNAVQAVPFPTGTLAEAVRLSAPLTIFAGCEDDDFCIKIGSGPVLANGLQVTFDGWAGAVVPAGHRRLAERERCVLAGVLAGALAVSEAFLDLTEVTAKAARRAVGVSLWRPDLPFHHGDAVGPKVAYLPAQFWSLGLGHLGQAYLWSLALLPFGKPAEVSILLQDYDRVIPANLGTQMLTAAGDVGRQKTRVAARFLERRGFLPLLTDRRFDKRTVISREEPKLALCGFDGAGPRHLLDRAGFEFVLECGLGDRADNFDDMTLHTLPIAGRRADEIWPAGQRPDIARAEELAKTNAFYRAAGERHRCGHVELAGKAVAVPFVGATAASLLLAESLRMFHEGERYAVIELRLEDPAGASAVRVEGGYRGRQQPRAIGSQAARA